MGQEERKNKAKLEKTQINLATSNTEYENAVKVLEDTTGRWNRDWKAAADKFQDLEEERLDFMKSSLWSYANIASTVCVSDDAACEKVRLSLENCEVEKDIMSFIKERGTGQEIPDPPKYINFCRGDVSDSASEVSEDDNYSVAQFQRTINPAYRSSSPAPSTLESHHAPHPIAAKEIMEDPPAMHSRETTVTPQTQRTQYQQPSVNSEYEQQPERLDYPQQRQQTRQLDYQKPTVEPEYQQQPQKLAYKQPPPSDYQRQPQQQQPRLDYQKQGGRHSFDQSQRGALAQVPHDPYPMDGMTMLCRTGPPSERSSAHSPVKDRPSSREDDHSEYSNPTSFSSMEPPSGKTSPVKQVAPVPEKQVAKKKSGFFNSPFRRKSQKEKENPVQAVTPSNRNTWSARSSTQNTPSRRPGLFTGDSRQNMLTDRPSGSPEPVDPRASFQLNVGNNVFDVATPDRNNRAMQKKPTQADDSLDPIAQALAELNDVTKASSSRVSADNYHGIATPAPNTAPISRPGGNQMSNGSGMRGTPPPSYDQPVQRLGLPQPAFTAKAMQQTRQKYVDQTQSVFGGNNRSESQIVGFGQQQPQSRPGTRGSDMPRATSPAPPRGTSPRPGTQAEYRQQARSVSPNPYAGSQHGGSQYGGSQRSRTQSYSPQKRGSDQYFRHNSPGDVGRSVSPNPYQQQERPTSSHVGSDMAMQLAPVGDDGYGSQGRGSSRAGSRAGGRPASTYYGNQPQQQQLATRTRSKSVADVRKFNSQGRPILHFGKSTILCFENYTNSHSSCNVRLSGSHSRRVEFCERRYPCSSQTSRRWMVGGRDCWKERQTWVGS